MPVLPQSTKIFTLPAQIQCFPDYPSNGVGECLSATIEREARLIVL
jgi:hypothetical protein